MVRNSTPPDAESPLPHRSLADVADILDGLDPAKMTTKEVALMFHQTADLLRSIETTQRAVAEWRESLRRLAAAGGVDPLIVL